MKEKYWWLTEESQAMLERGYLLPNQTVEEKLNVICKYAASFYKDEVGLKERFLEIFERGWCSLSSPIWANFGEDRGLPISCFSSFVPDDLDKIYGTLHEVAMMTKLGGGTSGYFGKLRPLGTPIKGGGISSGLMSFTELFDTTTKVVSQSGVRRGAFAAYLDIDHPEIEEFLKVKDKGHSLQTINTAVSVSDEWMKQMKDGDKEKRELWAKILKSRREKGIPYIFFSDTANRNKPQIYKDTNSTIHSSNLCMVGSDRVVSDRGYLTAQELYEQGGELILFDGEKPIKSSEMKLRERNAEVYKVTLENGMTHTVTSYHGMAKINDKNEIERTELKDLKIGDYIAVQTKKGLFGTKAMVDEAFLLGLYQSDGTQHKDNIMIDLWENDFDLIEEINSKFSNVFYKYGCDKYKIQNQYGVEFERNISPPKLKEEAVSQSDIKKMRLVSNCLKKSLNFEKGYVPTWIWESNEETQWEYVRGLLYADGTVFKSSSEGNPIQISYADINYGFLEDLQKLFNNLGLSSSIRLLKKEGEANLPDGKGGYKNYNVKNCYRLIVGNKNDALIIEEKTKFLSRKNIDLDKREYRDNTKKRYKVKSIEFSGYEDVYCPTVYTDEHIFVANGMLTFNCSEIFLPTSEMESFVCCLMSMNLSTYDEWKNTDAVRLAVMILDAVMSDFIKKTKNLPYMQRAHNFAVRHRALGLGVLGWHSLLQQKMIPFESFEAQQLNTSIFKYLKEKSYEASIELGEKYGYAPIFEGVETTDTKRRNTTLMAIAPTTSSSSILGQVSPSIEPYASNYFVAGLAKGSFSRKNTELEKLLESKGKNTEDVWKNIIQNQGSVQQLGFLSENEKKVFKTFQEISPLAIIQQAAARQSFIDQGQSVNLKIPSSMGIKDINTIHMEAWELGLKSLYYQRGTSVAKEAVLEMMECKSCEG